MIPYREDKTFLAHSFLAIPTCDWCIKNNLRLMNQMSGVCVEEFPDSPALRDHRKNLAFEEECRNKKCRACGRGPGDEELGQPTFLLRYCGGCRKALYCGACQVRSKRHCVHSLIDLFVNTLFFFIRKRIARATKKLRERRKTWEWLVEVIIFRLDTGNVAATNLFASTNVVG